LAYGRAVVTKSLRFIVWTTEMSAPAAARAGGGCNPQVFNCIAQPLEYLLK
jgi:hypothetical protein